VYNFELRKQIKLKFGSYLKFQEATGVHFNMVSMVVCGYRKPSFKLKTKFARALDCPMKEIFPEDQEGVGFDKDPKMV